jgi:molybdenum cofactor guanylyltransferase
MTELTITILAGGKSSRMGHNKALLRIGEHTIIERVIRASTSVSPSEILVVTNTPQDSEHLGHRMVADTITGQGAIGGIVSALHHSQTDAVLVLACDLPFVRSELLEMLITEFHQEAYQAVMPTVEGYPQGVLAIYHKDCLSYFESAIQNDQRKLKTIFAQLEHVSYMDESHWENVDPNGYSFINVNTPDELVRARDLWRKLEFNEQYSP